eukprot:750137-Hanusia_phi.AAC.1
MKVQGVRMEDWKVGRRSWVLGEGGGVGSTGGSTSGGDREVRIGCKWQRGQECPARRGGGEEKLGLKRAGDQVTSEFLKSFGSGQVNFP